MLRSDQLTGALRVEAQNAATPVAAQPAVTPAPDRLLQAQRLVRAVESFLREECAGRVFTGSMAGHVSALHDALLACAMAEGLRVQQPAPGGDDWCYSRDEETYHGPFDSREEAIGELQSALEIDGDGVAVGWVAKCRRPTEFIPAGLLGTNIEETVGEYLSNECGEAAEHFSLKPEERTALGKAVIDWIDAGPGFHCWAVRDVEQVEVSAS